MTAYDLPYVLMRTLSPRSKNTQGHGSSGPWLGAAPPFSLSPPPFLQRPPLPPLHLLSLLLSSLLSPQALLSAPDSIDPAQRTQTTPTTTTVLDASFAQTHSFSLRHRLKYLPLPPAAARRRSTPLKETRDTPRSAAHHPRALILRSRRRKSEETPLRHPRSFFFLFPALLSGPTCPNVRLRPHRLP